MRISDWSSDVCSSDLGAVIGEIDETDVGTTGCALIGVIAARDRRTAPIVRSSPDLTMRKRCTLDQPLPFGPSIKLVERGNRPVPRRCRNPELSIAAPPGTMIEIGRAHV